MGRRNPRLSRARRIGASRPARRRPRAHRQAAALPLPACDRRRRSARRARRGDGQRFLSHRARRFVPPRRFSMALGRAMLRKFGAFMVIEVAELDEDRLLSPDSPFLPAFETILTLQDRPAVRCRRRRLCRGHGEGAGEVPLSAGRAQDRRRGDRLVGRARSPDRPARDRLRSDLPRAEDRAALSRPAAPAGGDDLRRLAPRMRGVSRSVGGVVPAHPSGPGAARLRRSGRARGPPHRPDRAIVRLPAGNHPDQCRGCPAGVPVEPVRGGATAALPAADR